MVKDSMGSQTAATDASDLSAAAPVGDGPMGATGKSREEELAERLAQVEKEKTEHWERLLRTTADFDNFRKRSRREVDEAASRGQERILSELLPVLDNLERAVAHASASTGESTAESVGGSMLDGIRLTVKQFIGALEKVEVKRFASLGEPFDPTRHEAVQQVPTAEAAPGVIVQEFRSGYTIGQRLLRPAMVAVAAAPVGGAADDAQPTSPSTSAETATAAGDGPDNQQNHRN
jgi:molecular chaperone GrpE